MSGDLTGGHGVSVYGLIQRPAPEAPVASGEAPAEARDRPSQPIQAVCAVAGRSLTPQEWRRYLPPDEPFRKIRPE